MTTPTATSGSIGAKCTSMRPLQPSVRSAGQGAVQVIYQVGRALEADRQAQQIVGRRRLRAFDRCAMFDQALRTAEAGGTAKARDARSDGKRRVATAGDAHRKE